MKTAFASSCSSAPLGHPWWKLVGPRVQRASARKCASVTLERAHLPDASVSTYEALDDDALYAVLGQLDAHTLLACARCDRRTRRLALEQSLWRALLVAQLRSLSWPIAEPAAHRLPFAVLQRLLLQAPGAMRLPHLEGPNSRALVIGSDDGRGSLLHPPHPPHSPRSPSAATIASPAASDEQQPESPVVVYHELVDPLPRALPAAYIGAAHGAAPATPSAPATTCPAAPCGAPSAIPPDHRLVASYVGERLGGNRAVRCEPPLPSAPFEAVRVVASAAASGAAAVELRVDSGCCVAYFEVAIRPAAVAPPALGMHAVGGDGGGGDGDGDGDGDGGGVGGGDGGVDDSMACIAIGLGTSSFPLRGRQPGWDQCSYGYHSDDGRLFHGSGLRSKPFGPRYTVGDVVGCGLCIGTRQIFYTLNGRFLGVAFVANPKHVRPPPPPPPPGRRPPTPPPRLTLTLTLSLCHTLCLT